MLKIAAEMNQHGALVLADREGHATYRAVEYTSSGAKQRMADLPAGSVVRLSLTRTGARANVWRAERVLPGRGEGVSVSA